MFSSYFIGTRKYLSGILVVSLIASISMKLAQLPWALQLRISPLIIGIILGVVIGNTVKRFLPTTVDSGIVFAASKILRLAIILYGFRITFHQILGVGIAGVAVDVIMVSTTLLLGLFVGVHLLKMDRQTTIMTAAGAAICGAAAVIATEPVVKAEPHKTAVAIATVVCFGTLSMFLYPIAYSAGLVPMDLETFGVYVGSSVHEVAHVVGAAEAIGPETAEVAVIVKMTRVMLLAPTLLFLGWYINRKTDGSSASASISVPWFALGFVAVAGLNSFDLIPLTTKTAIIRLDTYLLTMAMSALGLNTVLSKFQGIGLKPVYLALSLFVWLVVGGFVMTKLFF